jgi:hypothetical protein
MQNPSKYREYAEECRRLAQKLPLKDRDAILEIANAWTRLAEDEERKEK